VQEGVKYLESGGKKSEAAVSFAFTLGLIHKGFTLASWKDKTGVVLQTVDHHPGEASESSSEKRLNANYHLPPFLLEQKFPAVVVDPRWLLDPR
jgi:hypothetical protein